MCFTPYVTGECTWRVDRGLMTKLMSNKDVLNAQKDLNQHPLEHKANDLLARLFWNWKEDPTKHGLKHPAWTNTVLWQMNNYRTGPLTLTCGSDLKNQERNKSRMSSAPAKTSSTLSCSASLLPARPSRGHRHENITELRPTSTRSCLVTR